ncbi:MAG: HlyD family type I secretion periplasmic adaptor subunit [Gammaproteobacteria bacterium]|nr:HlyD family type I secretion periplasmic adaptor subunit [Gammaproteobacteria bacterium]HJO10861.1 HlyD family type I secretion periplasmic adaptor subunit [Gammaproteobacteria bacterium]
MTENKNISPVLSDAQPAQGTPNADTGIATPMRVGVSIFFLVFGVFGAWAALAPLEGNAYAPGSVAVKSYNKTVQHLEGGIVSEIRAQNGDFVNAGEALLVLDNTQSLAQLEINNGQFASFKATESRLIAERDGLDEVVYPAALSRGEIDASEEMNSQTQIFQARKSAYEGSIDVLEQRIEQLQSKLVGQQALKTSREELAASYAAELVDVQALLSQGFSDITRVREIERNYASFSGEAAELTAAIATTEIEIGEARLQILQQEREFRNEVVGQLGETQTRLKDVNERNNALQDIVSRTVVRAPEAGVVTGMQVHTVGGVIGAGSAIVDIVPQTDELIIDARISPLDIDRVAEGQETTIRFSTFSSAVPSIVGSVLNISADAMTDPNTGAPYYQARIEVTPEGMAELAELTLIPGMPADTFIATGSRTLFQYLLKPFTNAMSRSLIED